MSITLQKIRWSNFLSTGNLPTEIILNDAKTTLICGINGSGKSTLMDAICFALFNKPFRKINKPQLVNSITGKHMMVEIEFSTNKRDYLIRRGMKPNVFEVYQDGTLINQSADSRDYQAIIEQNILKMSYKTFCQIVVLGSANFTPFMQLPAAARREIIEDLLDIKIFTVMNSLLKDQINLVKNSLLENQHQTELTENSLKLNKLHIEQQKLNNTKTIQQKKVQIENWKTEIEKANDAIDAYNNDCNVLLEKMASLEQIPSKIDIANQTRTNLNRKLVKIEKDKKYYEETDHCSSCGQSITEEYKSQKLADLLQFEKKFTTNLNTLEPLLNSLVAKKQELEDFSVKLQQIRENIVVNQANIKNYTNAIKQLENEIEQINNSKFDYIDLSADKQRLKALEKEKESLLEQRELNNIASLLLKDSGIKTQIIRQYIPIINTLINKYLDQMEFFCQFEIDEQFNEKIKSRFRDDFSYSSFSEGEKMRIDLALLFTWREIATLRNSAKINLLILDEFMDSSLDASGTDEFIKIVHQLTGNTNVVIISHKHDQIADKFDRVLKFTKVKNFSKLGEAA